MIERRAIVPVLLALCAPTLLRAQNPSETAVEAAYLVKFGGYVTWPSSDGPIVVCAVGKDVFGNELERAARGQQINDRPLTVKKLDRVGPESGCMIAYLAGAAHQSVAAALSALKDAPVLTVTDGRWSSARGMIHFQIVRDRVRFHIDERSAAESGLGISSKLLALALSVRQRGGR